MLRRRMCRSGSRRRIGWFRGSASVKIPKLRWTKRHWLLTAVVLAPTLYLAHIASIHRSNSRHWTVWGNIENQATRSGIVTRPVPDPPGLTRFYDQSKSFRTRSGLTLQYAGFADTSGSVVIPAVLQGPRETFSEGLVFASHANGQRGYFNAEGALVVAVSFDYADPFVNGMAEVRVREGAGPSANLRSGYIDRTGAVVVPLKYREGTHFVGPYALVFNDSVYARAYDWAMDGIDVEVGLAWLLPPSRAMIIDQKGKRVSLRDASAAFHPSIDNE